MTTIDNLHLILKAGCLKSKNLLQSDQIIYRDIADPNIQEERHHHTVTVAPYGTLHDYVPFYWAPRSPMLYRLYCSRADLEQHDLIYLVSTAQCIHEAKLPYVFYDGHPIAAFSDVYNTLEDIHSIHWDNIMGTYPADTIEGGYCRYFKDTPTYWDRMRKRQAEFLIKDKLEWKYIAFIATFNDVKAKYIEEILNLYGYQTPVKVKIGWYF